MHAYFIIIRIILRYEIVMWNVPLIKISNHLILFPLAYDNEVIFKVPWKFATSRPPYCMTSPVPEILHKSIYNQKKILMEIRQIWQPSVFLLGPFS